MLCPCRQPLLRSATDIQPQGRIDPIHALVVPGAAHRPQAIVTLPEAHSGVLAGQGQKIVNNGLIILRCALIAIGAAGHANGVATLTDAHLVLLVHIGDHFPLAVRAYSFFSTASLRA